MRFSSGRLAILDAKVVGEVQSDHRNLFLPTILLDASELLRRHSGREEVGLD